MLEFLSMTFVSVTGRHACTRAKLYTWLASDVMINKKTAKYCILLRHKKELNLCLFTTFKLSSLLRVKLAHFDFQGYGGAWTESYERVCLKVHTYLVIFNLFRS